MPSSVFKIVLFLSTLSLCAGEEGLEDPTVTLVCNATDKRFEINVVKNGHEYVALYAPNYENHSGDSRCWKYDDNEPETGAAFDFQLEVNSVDKDDPEEDVGKPQPCGVVYRADLDSYYFEFYVSTTEMILTSSAIYYNATCEFSTDKKRYTVSDSISNQDEQYDRTRTGDEKDPNIRNVALNNSDDGAAVGISLHVYSLEDQEYSTSLSVGDPIRLVVLDSTSDNGVQTLQLFAECNMYSDDQRSDSRKYVLTDYTGCAVESNKLFSGSLQLYDFDETRSENIGNASTFGLMTPEFETPYYSSSVGVYFECLVDRCAGDECIADEPDCSGPDDVDANSDAINQDSVQYSPAEYMQYTQQANRDTFGQNQWYEEEQESAQDFEDYNKRAAHRSEDSSRLIRSNIIFVSGLPRHALTDPYLYSSGDSKDYNHGTLSTRRNYHIEEQSRAMEAIKFILVITMILSILVTSLIAAAYILKRLRRPTGGWDKQMVV